MNITFFFTVHHHPKGVKNTVAKFLLGKCSSGFFRKVSTLFKNQTKTSHLPKFQQNVVNQHGRTPLPYACFYGHFGVVKIQKMLILL